MCARTCYATRVLCAVRHARINSRHTRHKAIRARRFDFANRFQTNLSFSGSRGTGLRNDDIIALAEINGVKKDVRQLTREGFASSREICGLSSSKKNLRCSKPRNPRSINLFLSWIPGLKRASGELIQLRINWVTSGNKPCTRTLRIPLVL